MNRFLVALGVTSLLCASLTQPVKSQPVFVLTWVGSGGGFNEPSGMAVDASGHAYVADLKQRPHREVRQ
ncbi:MAG: hypothetical protein ACE5G2_08615 [Candidatus Krumholzibacteriia bacterium]